jgi:hypothetical protein
MFIRSTIKGNRQGFSLNVKMVMIRNYIFLNLKVGELAKFLTPFNNKGNNMYTITKLSPIQFKINDTILNGISTVLRMILEIDGGNPNDLSLIDEYRYFLNDMKIGDSFESELT